MKLVKITAIWCLSCIFMNEVLKKVEKDKTLNYETVNYDFDENQAEIQNYNIGTTLPVYILTDENNNEIARSVGEKSEKELTEFFSKNGGF